MINYLAVDFGTSNCLAGRLVLTNGVYKLKLIDLEEGKDSLPSVIFVRQPDLPPFGINADVFAKRVSEELQKEEKRVDAALKEIQDRIEAYKRANSPKVKKPDPKNYISNSLGWKRAIKLYEEDIASLPIAIERFMSEEVEKYRKELQKHLRPKRTVQDIENQVHTEMIRTELEQRSQLLWEKTFFAALNDDSMETLYGTEALEAYSSDPLSGFFLRSPKAFLAISLHEQHRELFIKAISRMLKRIRVRAETGTKLSYDGLVIGRPINFMGAGDEHANNQATEILVKAAQRAGFAEVRFVYEPLAAALALRRKLLDTDDPVVIIDIGGGTTDVAYLRVLRNQKVDFEIKAVGGERVGGNDFDSDIARARCANHLGVGRRFKTGQAIPARVTYAALNTLVLQDQLFFRNSGDEIDRFMAEVRPEDRDSVFRLRDMYIRQLQHRVLLKTEELKQNLSDSKNASIDFDFFEIPYTVNYDVDKFTEDCVTDFVKITSIIREVLCDSGQPEVPVRAFLTGGMSLQPQLVKALQAALPEHSMIEFMPPFKSIVGGLSLVAHELNSVSSVNVEPDVVRGIPVLKR